MVRVEVTYEGELHTRATHGPSGTSLETDAPVDNQGRGGAFSPTDLVGTALATCMLTIMGIAARSHGWALEGASASVEKEMAADPPRRISRLTVRFAMPESLDQDARAVIEEAAAGCPVHRSLHPDTVVDIAFHYGDQ